MFERYFTIPFKIGGRDWSGCDCWGFARLVLLEEKGVELPLFQGVCSTEEFENYKSIFRRMDNPDDYCLVHMRPIGSFAHVGIYYQGYVLHIIQRGVVMQQVNRIPHLIKGYYRTEV